MELPVSSSVARNKQSNGSGGVTVYQEAKAQLHSCDLQSISIKNLDMQLI